MTRYAQGGHVGPPNKYMPAVAIRHGEYIYRDRNGTVWHVQQHPDGDIRTPLNAEEPENE